MKRTPSRKRNESKSSKPKGLAPWLSLRADARGEVIERWPIYVAAAATWVMTLPLFEPWSWWPIGYLALVPWTLAVCGAKRTGHVHLASLVLGAAFFLTQFRWLYTTTPEGYVAASLYLAAYFLLASWLIRHLYRKRRVPAVIGFPVVWVAVELLRSRGPLGFPWFLLGHSQIHLPTMIQIADLAGVYGVSFVVAAVSGGLVDVLLALVAMRRAEHKALPVRVWRGTGIMLLLAAFTVFYGRYRLTTQQLIEGPRVAVVQGDYLLAADPDAPGVPDSLKQQAYRRLMDEAEAGRPDLLVLPETPWTMYLNEHGRPYRHQPYRPSSQEYHEDFIRRVALTGMHLVVGAMGEVPQPAGAYPPWHRYNCAYVYVPRLAEPDWYAKIHLVPFGEFVPFRYTRHLYWLYRWLNDSDFNPWGRGGVEYSLTPGRSCTTFQMHPRGAREPVYRFAVTICYEDVIPQLFRRFVTDDRRRKRVDFMLNISNDGWFGHGAQQPQHLVNCAFRAVENRVAIARAVNTGISGFIRPDGTWYEVTGESRRHPRAGGLATRTANLVLDSRVTLYSRLGDLPAGLCVGLALGAAGDALVRRWRGRPKGGRGAAARKTSKG